VNKPIERKDELDELMIKAVVPRNTFSRTLRQLDCSRVNIGIDEEEEAEEEEA
jgi:hypothetical protein